MDEIGLRDTVDPLAGSYFIETLTKELDGKILEEMEKVERFIFQFVCLSVRRVEKVVLQCGTSLIVMKHKIMLCLSN